MTLIEKLNAFEDLDEKQKNIAISKYLNTINLCGDDIKEIIAYLKSKGVNITKAKEIKIGTIALEEIKTKVDNLESIEARDLIVEHPLVLTANDKCLAIRRRIMTCRQENIPYKDENGYLPLIWSDKAWNSVANNLNAYKEEKVEIEKPENTFAKDLETTLSESSIELPDIDAVLSQIDISPEENYDNADHLIDPIDIKEEANKEEEKPVEEEPIIDINDIIDTRERLQKYKDELINVNTNVNTDVDRSNTISMSSNEDYAKELNDTLGNMDFDFLNDELTFGDPNDEVLGGGRRAA